MTIALVEACLRNTRANGPERRYWLKLCQRLALGARPKLNVHGDRGYCDLEDEFM